MNGVITLEDRSRWNADHVDLHARADAGGFLYAQRLNLQPFTVAEWIVRWGLPDPNPFPRIRLRAVPQESA